MVSKLGVSAVSALCWRGETCSVGPGSLEWLDSNVLVEHGAPWIVSLERDCAGTRNSAPGPLGTAVPVRRLGPVDDLLVVYLHRDRFAEHSDRLGEPLIIFRGD
jgi:hypothetical protein